MIILWARYLRQQERTEGHWRRGAGRWAAGSPNSRLNIKTDNKTTGQIYFTVK
jgi:hypothetical protein